MIKMPNHILEFKLISILLFFLLVSCKARSNDHLVIEGFANTQIDTLIEKAKIHLQTEKEYVAQVTQLKIFNNYIAIVDRFIGQQVFIFNKNGELICKVGKKGKGPGEYLLPLIAKIDNNKIYIASNKTKRIEVFEIPKGLYLESFIFPLKGAWHEVIYLNPDTIVVLNLSRYFPFSVSIFNNQGEELIEFSKIDKNFGLIFDRYYPAGGIAIDEKHNIYQIFDHKYEVKYFNLKGELLRIYKLHSPYYHAPDYDRASHVKSREEEIEFFKSFSHINGIYLMDSNLFLVSFNSMQHKRISQVLEIWNTKGNFIARFIIPGAEKLLGVEQNKLYFIKNGKINAKGILENPIIIVRELKEKVISTLSNLVP
ncbi:MAG: 6-bladed beta-propeller [candidate division KSB1 bacterium]|nr:6-bladed beta-propeller [candidate division KSB1 bacterium]